jgi:hypothetical protein
VGHTTPVGMESPTPSCPVCGGLQKPNPSFVESAVGHRKDCELAAVLGEKKEEPQRGGAFVGYDEEGEPVEVQLWGVDLGTSRHDALRRIQRSSLRFQEFKLGNERLIAYMDRMRQQLLKDS